jgi:hypothetical protein
MLWAFLEGLAGVREAGACLQGAWVCPRWLAAGVEEAEVQIHYPASGATLGYQLRRVGDELRLELDSPGGHHTVMPLLPAGTRVTGTTVNGEAAPPTPAGPSHAIAVTQGEPHTEIRFQLEPCHG